MAGTDFRHFPRVGDVMNGRHVSAFGVVCRVRIAPGPNRLPMPRVTATIAPHFYLTTPREGGRP